MATKTAADKEAFLPASTLLSDTPADPEHQLDPEHPLEHPLGTRSIRSTLKSTVRLLDTTIMILAVVVLASDGLLLAPYFVAAWTFNLLSTFSARPFTLNSIDAAAARRSSQMLLTVALLDGALVVIGAPARLGWLLVCLFVAALLTDGVLQHMLVPYAGPLVLPQGDTTPPTWVHFHPYAWMLAVLINLYGAAAHAAAIAHRLPLSAPVACGWALAVLGLAAARIRSTRGAWARRDAAWYEQRRPERPRFRLLSPHQPTLSTYVLASDDTRLAADVWLPCAADAPAPDLAAPRPCVVHFTPYNRNWRVRANRLGLRLLRKFGVEPASRLFNTRSLRYLDALTPRGFAFVSVDLRGCGASFGARACDLLPREVDDLADVARWARAQPWCDGWLASGGISYDGMAAVMLAAALPRPGEALGAIFPLFAPMDAYEDLCVPGGVPCHGFADAYAAFRSAAERDAPPDADAIPMPTGKRLLFSLISGGDGDSLSAAQRRWLGALLRGGGGGVAPVAPGEGKGGGRAAGATAAAIAEAERLRAAAIAEHAANWDHAAAIRTLRFADDVMATVDGGREVLARELNPGSAPRLAALRASGTAVYAYAGWLDSGSVVSAKRLLDALAAAAPGEAAGGEGRLTIGPWNHGLRAACDAHANARGRTVPQFDMYGDLAAWLEQQWRAQRGGGARAAAAAQSPVHFYMSGPREHGGWCAAPTWPPPGVRDVRLLLCAEGGLAAAVEPAAEAKVRFEVEPAATTALASRWNLVQHILIEPVDYGDRRAPRGSLSFTSAPLAAPLAIAGAPRLRLALALDGGDDAAVFAYLEDVPPDARARVHYVTEGQLRAGFAAALEAGTCAYERKDWRPFSRGVVPLSMQPVAYTFDTGHRVRVTLAGADAANFLPLEGCATHWTIEADGASVLVLPEWRVGKERS